MCAQTLLVPLEWREVGQICTGSVIWTRVFYLWMQAQTSVKRVRICKVPGLQNVADANTKLADRRSHDFTRISMGATHLPKQFRDTVLRQVLHSCLSLCHSSRTHAQRKPSSSVIKSDESRFGQRECQGSHYTLFIEFLPKDEFAYFRG